MSNRGAGAEGGRRGGHTHLFGGKKEGGKEIIFGGFLPLPAFLGRRLFPPPSPFTPSRNHAILAHSLLSSMAELEKLSKVGGGGGEEIKQLFGKVEVGAVCGGDGMHGSEGSELAVTRSEEKIWPPEKRKASQKQKKSYRKL